MSFDPLQSMLTCIFWGAKRALRKERTHTTEIVKGLDDAIKSGVVDKDKLAPAMNAAQSLTTRQTVDRIQEKTKAA